MSVITIGLLIVVSLSIAKLPPEVVILPFNFKSLEDISNESGLYLMKLSGSPPTIEVVLFAGNEIVSSVNFMFDPFTFTVISLSLNETFCSLLFFVFVILNPALVVILAVVASIEVFLPLSFIVLAVFDI